MKRITMREEVCMGCGLCEVHCIVQHSTSKDVVKAYKREHPRPLSRVRVEEARPLSLAVRCQHCEDPPCVDACLSGAMQRDEDTRLVQHDVEKCMGCWTCIAVCPYGALRMDVAHRVVVKCDLCPPLDTPACVAHCPNGALIYQEMFV